MKNLFRFRKLQFNWQFGLTLILLFGIPRFLLVLEANRTGNYNFTSIIFVIMVLTPFLLLSNKGRELIGIKWTKNLKWLGISFVLGVFASTIIFFLGKYLYQESIENWFVYISKSYSSIPVDELKGDNKLVYFAMFAGIGMTFSPIGEELLYRGLIHQSFVPEFGNNKASILDSLAFAIVHLAHFGIVHASGNWKFLFVPAFLWMTLMFLASRLFFYSKNKTGSIYGAILSHAGFNFAMTYFIFYYIL
ncbi:MAG: type II CAAX endopeptidase family protein [Eudoraea sp.]|uniref:CPBP family intramembrane glutamic endopeptidase n=1 Tax=Eudoraea sp. TaxID=1979955 RepID=UPI003C789513